jgi:hypothetical protein
MKQVWGFGIHNDYTDKTKQLVFERLPKCREVFAKEFAHALGDEDRTSDYCRGTRYYDDSKILWVIQSRFTEAEFLSEVDYKITQVLLGACGADWHYTYEKDWN